MDVSAAEVVARARAVVAREAEGVRALAAQLDERLVEVLEVLLRCEGHVLVTGMGTSHAMSRRFAHLLSCSGVPALCVSAADGLHGGSGAVTERDVVYVISKGGRSTELNRFVEIARGRGATIVAQTEALDSPLARISDVVFCVRAVGEVDPYGLIATGSSLVTGAAGDVLCTLLLERRGYTREAFGETHPGGAVGQILAQPEPDQEEGAS